MKRYLQKFLGGEDGAVTVDWVVLTAAIVGLAVAAVASAGDGVNTLASKISAGVADETVK